jgi:hypothetical protein
MRRGVGRRGVGRSLSKNLGFRLQIVFGSVLELRRLRRFGAWRWREVDDTVFSIVWWECKQIDLLPFLPFYDGILHACREIGEANIEVLNGVVFIHPKGK